MKETGQNIANMIETMRGEHCLFRSFGMDETDKPGLLNRNAISQEVAKWYPNVKTVSIERTGVSAGSSYSVRIVEE